MAVFIAVTISDTFDDSEPVHWYVQPSRAQASWMPYWVAWKKGFVVTWLTNTNLYFGVLGKSPTPPDALADEFEPHADRNAVAAAERPTPLSRVRRVAPDRGGLLGSRRVLGHFRACGVLLRDDVLVALARRVRRYSDRWLSPRAVHLRRPSDGRTSDSPTAAAA